MVIINMPRLLLIDLSPEVNQEEMKNLRVGTAELLEMLMEQEPLTEFSFALGQDTFMDLTTFKWRRTRDIFSLLNC